MFPSPSDLFLKQAGDPACSPLRVRALVIPLRGRKVVLSRAERERTCRRILTERGARPSGGAVVGAGGGTSSNCATRAGLAAYRLPTPACAWNASPVTVGGEKVANAATLPRGGSVSSAGKEPEDSERGSRTLPRCLRAHTLAGVWACLLSAIWCVLCFFHCSISPAGCAGQKGCDCRTGRDVIHPGSGRYIRGVEGSLCLR